MLVVYLLEYLCAFLPSFSLQCITGSHTFMSWVISCATRVLLMLYSFLCFCCVTWAHLLSEAATKDFLFSYCVSRQAHTHKSMMILLQLIGLCLKHYPVKPLECARYIGFNLLKECSYPPQLSCATGIRLCLTSCAPILQQSTPNELHRSLSINSWVCVCPTLQ